MILSYYHFITAGAFITPSQSVYTTNETSPVMFQCTATSFHVSGINWYRNGVALSDPRVTVGSSSHQLLSSGLYQVTQTLSITNTTDTDSGNYSCMANNTAVSQSATFLLVVQCKPYTVYFLLAHYFSFIQLHQDQRY